KDPPTLQEAGQRLLDLLDRLKDAKVGQKSKVSGATDPNVRKQRLVVGIVQTLSAYAMAADDPTTSILGKARKTIAALASPKAGDTVYVRAELIRMLADSGDFEVFSMAKGEPAVLQLVDIDLVYLA